MRRWNCILALLFAPLIASAAPKEVTFKLTGDAAGDVTHLFLYRNFKKFGSQFSCSLKVQRPEPGAPAVQSDSNMLSCDFNLDDGHQTHNEWLLGRSTVEGFGQKNDTDTFIVKGDFAFQFFSALHDAFKTIGEFKPDSLLWDREIECYEDGKKCTEEYTLNTWMVEDGKEIKVPQIMCQRVSMLVKETAVRVDRNKFFSRTDYVEETIWQQLVARERGFNHQVCIFLVLRQ